jgi:diadenosine tetraphosphate (Ap4A) HIT family hydrolase
MDCVLCSPELGPVLAGSPFWRLVLNRNQNLVGKCMLVTRRHVEVVDQLTAAEWSDLAELLRRATAALRQAMQPDHFNYAFLQNQDRHVHLHVIPRYAGPRCIAGLLSMMTTIPAITLSPLQTAAWPLSKASTSPNSCGPPCDR